MCTEMVRAEVGAHSSSQWMSDVMRPLRTIFAYSDVGRMQWRQMSCNIAGVRRRRRRCRSPIFFEEAAIMFPPLRLQEKISSEVMLRWRWLLACGMFEFKVIFRRQSGMHLERKTIHTVFEVLIVKCEMRHQIATWSAADCKRTFNSNGSDDGAQARVSSANKLIYVSRGVVVTRSFIYTENTNGLNIAPRRPACNETTYDETQQSNIVNCWRLARKLWNHWRAEPRTPAVSSFLSRP